MNSQTKKTAYLIGVGASVVALATAVTVRHSAQVAEEERLASAELQETQSDTSSTPTPINQNTNVTGDAQAAVNTNSVVNINTTAPAQETPRQTTTAQNTNTTTSTPAETAPKNTNTQQTASQQTNVAAPTGSTGTYSAKVSYAVPEGDTNSCEVSITLSNSVVTAVSVKHTAHSGDSRQYQSGFDKAYKTIVVGKSISSLTSLSRIGGATLTTNAFKKAVQQIQSQL